MLERRVIRINSSLITKGKTKIRCPFCAHDVSQSSCEHLEKVETPVYRNALTGSLFGNYIYWFIKDIKQGA